MKYENLSYSPQVASCFVFWAVLTVLGILCASLTILLRQRCCAQEVGWPQIILPVAARAEIQTQVLW